MADYPLAMTGIYELFENQFSGFRPEGWIKQLSWDFEVREVRGDEILEARTENRIERPEGSGQFVRFTVSKRGVSSPMAEASICQAVGASQSELGVSGRKDSQALTSGRMSLPVKYLGKLVDLDLDESIWIQDLAFDEEPIQNGSHSGNNFRIVIRPGLSGEIFEEMDLQDIEENFDVLESNGFVNFWGDQRFGTRRISQIIGARMIAADWLGAAKLLLYESPKYEQAEFRQARQLALRTSGWPKKREILSHGYFGQERRFIELLERYDSLQQALMEGEINFLLSAWGSWMWNQAISVFLFRGWDLPRTFPSFRGIPSEDEWNEVGEEYERVGINLPPYPGHLQQKKAHVIHRPTKVEIDHGHLEEVDEYQVVVSFTLPVSVYATIALENLAEVREYDVEGR